MLERLKPLLTSHNNLPLQIAGVIFIYSWAIFSRTTYLYFLLGVFSTLFSEGLFIWQYLGSKILKESGEKINLELAKIEIRRVFGNDIGVNYRDVERKIKKKNYYQNNKSKPLTAPEGQRMKGEATPFPGFRTGKEPSFAHSITNLDEKPTFSHRPMNELLKLKDRSPDKDLLSIDGGSSKKAFERRATIVKLGRKNYNGQLTEYLKIIEYISTSEKTYGKALYKFGTKAEEESLLDKEEKEVTACDIDSLNGEDLAFMKKKFGEYIQYKQALVLPTWKVFKDALSFIGKIHFNCSSFVSQISVGTIDLMSVEYNENYVKLKAEKKKIAKDYEEAYVAYFKLKNEYETLYSALETALNDYQVKFKKKESDEVVLRYEMKARLLKSQLDSLRNKLVSATDKLKELARTVNNENDKLTRFIKDWNLRKASVCQNVLRSIISILEETAVDSERAFEKLFGNIEDLYCSFNDLDEIEDLKHHDKSFEEENDVNAKISKQKSVLERKSPSKFNSAMKGLDSDQDLRNSHNEPSKLTISELESMFKEFKTMLSKFNKIYEQESERYSLELKKSKEVLGIIKRLAEFVDEYTQEKTKVVSFTSIGMGVQSLNIYWAIVQENIRLVTNFSIQLHEKLVNLEKMYAENVRNFEKEFKNSEIVVHNAVKRGERFVKNMDRELSVKSFGELINKWFHKGDSNGHTNGAIEKIFGPETTRPYNKDEDPIAAEKEYLKNDFNIGLMQIKNAIKSFQKEAVTLKKDLVLAYLQCYCSQKQLLFALVKEIDKMDHFTESLENQIQEIYEDSNEDVDEPPVEGPKPLHRFDSALTPIQINKIPELELELLEEEKNQSLNSEDGSFYEDNEGQEKTCELFWINKLLKVFIAEWSKSAYFKEKMMKSLYTAFNKKRAKLIKQIKVQNFILGDKAPEIRSVTTLPSDKLEFLADVELKLQGNLSFEIQVQFQSQPILDMLNNDKPMFIDVKILVRAITGTIRLCWVPTEYGTSWFSFVGEPILDLKVEPKVGQTQFDLTTIPQVTSLIKEILEQRIRKMTYPYRKELDLPMAFRTIKVLPLREEEEMQVSEDQNKENA